VNYYGLRYLEQQGEAARVGTTVSEIKSRTSSSFYCSKKKSGKGSGDAHRRGDRDETKKEAAGSPTLVGNDLVRHRYYATTARKLGSLGARFGGEGQGKWRGRRGLFIGARWRQMGQENGGVDGSHHWLKAVSRGVRS
jgi:hypothetical protein